MREWRGEVELEICEEAVFLALLPEVKNPPTTSRTRLDARDMKIIIQADDVSALRAAVNSFMYWIYSASEVLRVAEGKS